MDELSKVLAGLMAQSEDTPEEGGNAQSVAAPDGEQEPAALPGDFDIMGLLGGMGGPPPGNKMEVLTALKPYLDESRRTKIDRACSLVRTAYMVRTALSTLGGMINV